MKINQADINFNSYLQDDQKYLLPEIYVILIS